MNNNRCRTRQNTLELLVGTTPIEGLPPNPLRKSILLTPMAAGAGSSPAIVAVVFGAGADQAWTIPPGVTRLASIYAWGAGNQGGEAGGGLGGGGGGGGGFSAMAPLDVSPGDIWLITVDPGNGGASTFAQAPDGSQPCIALSGAAGVGPLGGNGGLPDVGVVLHSGGNGAAGAGAVSGGGGGSAGYAGNGTSAAGRVGGAGAGGGGLLGYGAGATGGNGALAAGNSTAGAAPGAGGGGQADGGAGPSAGADGQLIIFYEMSPSEAAISLSHRQDVQPGKGVLNYVPGAAFPTIVSDCEIGDAIGLPWWIVSGVDNVYVQIVEYSYEQQEPGARG